MGFAETSSQALGYQGRHFTLLRRHRCRGAGARASGRWSRRWRCAFPRVPLDRRQAHDDRAGARASARACADAGTRRSRCPRARRSARSTSTATTCTLCLACVGACPEGAILDHAQSEVPQLRFIETQVRAMRAVRRDLSRGCDPPGAAAVAGARGEAAARAQRGGDFPLHALRQAAGHREDDRQHAGEAGRTFDVRRAGVARPAQDVRRLPRDRQDGKGAGPASR